MFKYVLLLILLVFSLGFLIPESRFIPVQGATIADWNPRSFWHYPWGCSVTHKGIDIFAKTGTPVLATTAGLVLSSDENTMGGRYVLMLSAKWRLHYYAHLQKKNASQGQWLQAGEKLGTVGTSGNAQNRPPHLHYSIVSLLPRWWQAEAGSKQRWRRMFFILILISF